MRSLGEMDLFKVSRAILQFMGEEYDHTPKRIILFRIFNSTVLLYVAAFLIANFYHATGGSRVETIQSLISVVHTLLKYISYMYFKPGIQELLQNKFEQFWSYQHIDNHIIASLVKVYKVTELVQASILAGTIIVAYGYLFKPMLTVNNPFPLEAWASGDIFLDVTTLACHHYFLCIAIPIVIGYDAVYLCLCIQTVAQVKLLKNRMRHFQERVPVDCGYYIKCHQYLLSTFTRMRKLYSSMLLFHYFVTLITTCASLLEVLMRKSSTTDIATKTATIWLMFLQFAYYTFPAEMVAFELSDLSNSIYLSKWYLQSVKVQKQLLLMMAKSQDQLYFTGGGLIEINVKTFGLVVRTSFSFYTILRNVFTK